MCFKTYCNQHDSSNCVRQSRRVGNNQQIIERRIQNVHQEVSTWTVTTQTFQIHQGVSAWTVTAQTFQILKAHLSTREGTGVCSSIPNLKG